MLLEAAGKTRLLSLSLGVNPAECSGCLVFWYGVDAFTKLPALENYSSPTLDSPSVKFYVYFSKHFFFLKMCACVCVCRGAFKCANV